MTDISSLGGVFSAATQSVSPIAPDHQVERLSKQLEEINAQGGFGPAYILSISPVGQYFVDHGNEAAKLSDEQKQAIQTILQKYKDAPLNKATMDAIHNDLMQAGVAPEQLAAANAQGDARSNPDAKESPPPPPPPAGGKPPAGGGVSYTEISSAEESSKRKVRPLVGDVGADEVVDKDGNIDQVKLKELLDKQQEQAHQFEPDKVSKDAIALVS